MTASTRYRLAMVLVGIAGAYAALSVATWIRQDACLDAGGQWDVATRTCELLDTTASRPSAVAAYVIGALAGLVLAVVLWRTFTFFTLRAKRRQAR